MNMSMKILKHMVKSNVSQFDKMVDEERLKEREKMYGMMKEFGVTIEVIKAIQNEFAKNKNISDNQEEPPYINIRVEEDEDAE